MVKSKIKDSPRSEKLDQSESVVSDPAVEVIIRVVEHITGPRGAGESGQQDQPQHRLKTRFLKKTKSSYRRGKKLKKSCVLCPRQPGGCSAVGAGEGRGQRRTGRRRKRKRHRGGGTAPNHTVAACHWSTRRVTPPRSANGRRANGASSPPEPIRARQKSKRPPARSDDDDVNRGFLMNCKQVLVCVVIMLFNMSCTCKCTPGTSLQ